MEAGNQVGKGHLPAQQEGDWSGEETDGYEEGTKELQDARKSKQLEQARPVSPSRNPNSFCIILKTLV